MLMALKYLKHWFLIWDLIKYKTPMKNSRLSYLFLFCLASSLVLIQVGCGENKTQVELLRALDNVERISKKLDQIPMDSIANVKDRLSSAKDDIRWLGIDSNVVFLKADVKVIEGLSKASRFLKDAPSRYIGLMNEIDRCKKQLYKTKSARWGSSAAGDERGRNYRLLCSGTFRSALRFSAGPAATTLRPPAASLRWRHENQ